MSNPRKGGQGAGGKPMFERPFWISPHSRDRYRQRFGPASDELIEWTLNVQLQRPEIPDAARIDIEQRGPALLYAVLINDVPSTAVVAAPPEVDIGVLPRPHDVWPVVMTVYPGRKHITKYNNALRQMDRGQHKPFDPTWQAWEIETAKLMRWIGYTMREIGSVLGRTEKQVERQICNRRVGVIMPRWTEEELQLACDMRFEGKTYAQIAARLGRSEQAVKHRMRRHREWVLSNPERAAFMRIMFLLKHPEKLLRAMRRTDMVARIADVLYDPREEERAS